MPIENVVHAQFLGHMLPLWGLHFYLKFLEVFYCSGLMRCVDMSVCKRSWVQPQITILARKIRGSIIICELGIPTYVIFDRNTNNIYWDTQYDHILRKNPCEFVFEFAASFDFGLSQSGSLHYPMQLTSQQSHVLLNPIMIISHK